MPGSDPTPPFPYEHEVDDASAIQFDGNPDDYDGEIYSETHRGPKKRTGVDPLRDVIPPWS